MPEFNSLLAKVSTGASLSKLEATEAFDAIMAGSVEPIQISAFLTALSVRGETTAEIIGGATAMRSHAAPIVAPEEAVDTCGTGGSGIDSFNISTAAAFITVAAGVPVAKHGNRAASSRSGSADVLEALGGAIELDFPNVQKALAQTGFTFMFARAHHAAMRYVAPVRAALKFKTIFNILGPLSSPCRAKRQVLGVFDRKLLVPMAEVLRDLGSVHAWIVHGVDGLDEITTTGSTYVAELKNGAIEEFEVNPSDVGLSTATLNDIKGGDADYNAEAIRKLFAGEQSAFRDITLLNAAASLIVGGKASTLSDGFESAAALVDDGSAQRALQRWIDFTQQAGI